MLKATVATKPHPRAATTIRVMVSTCLPFLHTLRTPARSLPRWRQGARSTPLPIVSFA
jgi:hypothetical protein